MLNKFPEVTQLTEPIWFVQYSHSKPASFGDISAVKVGPKEVGKSADRLDTKYWLINVVSGVFTLYEGAESGWINPIVLFKVNEEVTAVDVAFDQLGRPMVLYSNSAGDIKLYWYDPLASSNLIRDFGKGQFPKINIDDPVDVGDGDSDVWVAYVVDLDTIVLRVQRERFGTEYKFKQEDALIRLHGIGQCTDFRFRVIYELYDWEKMKTLGWEAEGKASGNWVEGE